MEKHGIKIIYGKKSLQATVNKEDIIWEIFPPGNSKLDNLSGAILKSIHQPVGSESLQQIIQQAGKKTLIIVDDNTRSTPQKVLLPILLDELNTYGVKDTDITVLIALGTHRPMTRQECIEKYGEVVMSRVKVINLSGEEEDFMEVQKTRSGIPVSVAKIYMESDVSIAVGSIIPHMYTGWSGGAKMIQPGITDKKTTAHTHLMAGENVYQILGNVNNPVRKEMEEIAVKTGLKFIINVVLNGKNEVVDVVSGDVIKAHREGVKSAEMVYRCTIPRRADVVIAGSHPADRDLWQGFKPLNNCGMMVKDGGTLILVIPAPEGISPDHPEIISFGTKTTNEIKELLTSNKISDGVSAATYMAFENTRKRIRIILVSDGISNAEARQIGIYSTDSLIEALAMVYEECGTNPEIGIVHHGADVLPEIEN